MAAIAGHPGGRVSPLNLSLFRLGHLNVPDIRRRLAAAGRATAKTALSMLRRKGGGLDTLLLDYTGLIGAPLRSDLFEVMLREGLSRPGSTNDFRELPRPFYVGASDQDTRKHVLFGDKGHDKVPISRAIQASLSINPAFSAVPIDGRYYEDGAVTRTSHFAEAVRRGAGLVFSVDPFVPYVSKESGVADRRGMLYNIDQDIRTLSFTRFERTRAWVLRRHPEVTTNTFLPSNSQRPLLSTNPMDHRQFLAIWRGAYLSTLRRIHALSHRLRGDLATHGIELDTGPADRIANQLQATAAPTFADFFVGRRPVLRRPRLALDA
jgi:predicted acylesterase/phospholipase RssA